MTLRKRRVLDHPTPVQEPPDQPVLDATDFIDRYKVLLDQVLGSAEEGSALEAQINELREGVSELSKLLKAESPDLQAVEIKFKALKEIMTDDIRFEIISLVSSSNQISRLH